MRGPLRSFSLPTRGRREERCTAKRTPTRILCASLVLALALVRCLAAEIAPEDRRSAYADMSRETKAMQERLVDVLDIPQSKVSRHLAYLRRAGLVTARKDGYWMHYTLAPASSEFHKSLLNCIACCFQSVPELARATP